MLDFRLRLERGFSLLGGAAYQRPWLFAFGVSVFLLLMIWQLQFIKIDTTNEGFLKKDDPTIEALMAFKKEFGRDEQFVISFQHQAIFSEHFLPRFIELHRRFEQEVPYVDSVNSLFNARQIYADGDELIVDDFISHAPQSHQDYEQLKARALSTSLYANTYLNDQANITNLFIRPAVFYALKSEQGTTDYALLDDAHMSVMRG